MSVKLKICGMKYLENIKDVLQFNPDYLGFIFYKKSKRYMVDSLLVEEIKSLPHSIKKVGVFVNDSFEFIVDCCVKYDLTHVQLHGDEEPELCFALKKAGFEVIKAFAMGSIFDFRLLDPFKNCVNYFLFDTKGDHYGGHGKTFDWELLKEYDNEIPIFLSGGIGPDTIEKMKGLSALNIHAIDVNSRVEVEPGIKDISKVNLLRSELNKINEYIG